MALYSLAQVVASTTTGAPAWDILTTSSTSAKLMEIGIFIGLNAFATIVGLGLSANTPVQTSGVSLLAEHPNDPVSQCTAATTWSTPPTAPSMFHRRMFATNKGDGMIWAFPQGISIPPASSSMVVWTFSTLVSNSSLDIYAVVDE